MEWDDDGTVPFRVDAEAVIKLGVQYCHRWRRCWRTL